ncbi:MAG: zf-TFIIB domain-containing protein [Bacteroidota bacterium]
MNCPTCKDVNLVMSERQGVEIDYCPSCRGVWLDRGELDKIIERASQPGESSAPGSGHRDTSYKKQPDYNHDRHKHGHDQHKKKNWLSDLFD